MQRHRNEKCAAQLLRERVELAVQMITSRMALDESRWLLVRLANRPALDI